MRPDGSLYVGIWTSNFSWTTNNDEYWREDSTFDIFLSWLSDCVKMSTLTVATLIQNKNEMHKDFNVLCYLYLSLPIPIVCV